MASLHISLSDPLRTFAEEGAKRRNFSTTSEYIRALLRQDQKKLAKERIDAALLEAVGSPSSPITDELIEEIRAEGKRRAGIHA